MSKVESDRPRHIAVRIEASAPVSRRAFSNAVRHAARQAGWDDAKAPQVTRYEWPHAALRVTHDNAAKARALLQGINVAIEGEARMPVKVTSLSTSGTLLALTTRLGILGDRETR